MLNLWEHVHLALQALRANWLRGLLTALGVIIGVASLVALTAVSSGALAWAMTGVGNCSGGSVCG